MKFPFSQVHGSQPNRFSVPQFQKWVLVTSSQSVELLSHHCFIKGLGLSWTEAERSMEISIVSLTPQGEGSLGWTPRWEKPHPSWHCWATEPNQTWELPLGAVRFPEPANHPLLLEDEVGFLSQGLRDLSHSFIPLSEWVGNKSLSPAYSLHLDGCV